MSRTKVKIVSAGRCEHKVGETRWLDELTGSLFFHEAGGTQSCGQWTRVNGQRDGDVRRWIDPDCWIVEEVVEQSYLLTTDPITPAVSESGYPDGNPKSVQGAKKYDLMYLPLPAKIEVNRALEDGAKKYGKANWRETGVSASVYLNAAMRHMDQYNEGQERASDSGVHNLGHAMACLAIIIDAAANGKLIDDRPTPCVDTDALLSRNLL